MAQEQSFAEKLCNRLRVDNTNKDEPWLTTTEALMKLIGVFGMSLPFLLWLFLYIWTGHVEVLESISHYFFTLSNPIFIIVVSLMAIFLMIYKRDKPIDFFLSFFAGLCALVVLLLPTDPIISNCSDFSDSYVMAYVEENSIRQWIHYGAAALFLIILNYMCFFLFTKTDKAKTMTKQKIKRNFVYYVCGTLMTLALFVIVSPLLNIINPGWYYENNMTFWMESLAVEAFGFSWLVKGGFIFKDY